MVKTTENVQGSSRKNVGRDLGLGWWSESSNSSSRSSITCDWISTTSQKQRYETEDAHDKRRHRAGCRRGASGGRRTAAQSDKRDDCPRHKWKEAKSI